MAFIANTFSFHFILFILLSLSLQLHARESKFFTMFTRYLSNAPTIVLSPVPAPAPAPIVEPVMAPGLAPAPAPAEEEYGYGLYGHGSSESSSEELYTTHETPEKKEYFGEDEYKSETDPQFEKLLSGESYSSNNGYNNNDNGYDGYSNSNGYMSSENKINGYNQNTFSNNGYNNNGNGYSNSLKENDYKTDSYSQNNYNNEGNRYSSSENQYNGYNNNDMSFENEKNGYNGDEYRSSEGGNNGYHNSNDNGYVMGQQGLSDTRFLENGKYAYDPNNNGNEHETSYEEEVSDNGEGYYKNNEDSRIEFDSMKLDP